MQKNKQAILLTAYKKPKQLLAIIDYFPDTYNFYVHIDKKSKIDLSELRAKKNLFIYSKYNVNWGGINHLRSILLLSHEALKNSGNIFFHLITGEDYPVKPVEFFEQCLDLSKNYLECFQLPALNWYKGGMDRIEYFHFHDSLNTKKSNQKALMDFCLRLQDKFRIKRKYSESLPVLFGGSSYWSLTRDTLGYVVNYTKSDDRLLKRFRFTFCPEEIYFQTVIMNSEYCKALVNDNLRYIDWTAGGSSPAYLKAEDFSNIILSNALFARKFELDTAKKLQQYMADSRVEFLFP